MKYKFESNYVPAKIAMPIKEEDKNMEGIGVIDGDVDNFGNTIQDYNQKYKIIWPLHIYLCQKIDFFGAKMYAVPYFQFRGSRMLWVVSSLLLRVEPPWDIISKSEIRRS